MKTMNGSRNSRDAAGISRWRLMGVTAGAALRRLATVAALVLLSLLAARANAVAVTDIEFSSRPGSKFEVRLDLSLIHI